MFTKFGTKAKIDEVLHVNPQISAVGEFFPFSQIGRKLSPL